MNKLTVAAHSMQKVDLQLRMDRSAMTFRAHYFAKEQSPDAASLSFSIPCFSLEKSSEPGQVQLRTLPKCIPEYYCLCRRCRLDVSDILLWIVFRSLVYGCMCTLGLLCFGWVLCLLSQHVTYRD